MQFFYLKLRYDNKSFLEPVLKNHEHIKPRVNFVCSRNRQPRNHSGVNPCERKRTTLSGSPAIVMSKVHSENGRYNHQLQRMHQTLTHANP